MDRLIGSVVNSVYISEDQQIMVFDTSNGIFAYETEADCCSETWFADLVGLQALIGSKITGCVEATVQSVEDGRSRQDIDTVYGYKIETARGVCDIVFRNSSSGWYGGSICLLDPIVVKSELTRITEDWSG